VRSSSTAKRKQPHARALRDDENLRQRRQVALRATTRVGTSYGGARGSGELACGARLQRRQRGARWWQQKWHAAQRSPRHAASYAQMRRRSSPSYAMPPDARPLTFVASRFLSPFESAPAMSRSLPLLMSAAAKMPLLPPFRCLQRAR